MNWLKKLSFNGGLILTTVVAFIWPTRVFSQTSPNIIWKQFLNSDRINSMVFTPDGNTLISGSSDRLINLWRTSDGELLQTLNTGATEVHESSIEWLAITKDGTRLASCNYRMVKLWRLPQGTEQDLTGHTDWVVGVAFSPNGTYLASASFDSTIKIWRVSDGALVKTLTGHNAEVRAVSFSPNGQYLASGGGDGPVRIWRTSDWTQVQTLVGHTSDIYTLTFSPDGKTLASGGYDHTVRVWNVATWALKYPAIQTGGNVYAIAYSPDSAEIAFSDGEANHIYLRRVSDGALLKTYSAEVNNVQTIAFSPSGLLGYGRVDRTVVLASTSAITPPVTDPPETNTPPTTPPETNSPPTEPTEPTSVAGDLNIFWSHAAGYLRSWTMSGTNLDVSTPLYKNRPVSPVWKLLGFGDFDGDGQTDWLWESSAGAPAVWLMNNTNLIRSVILKGKADPKWRIVGAHDFNGDGQPDILWQQSTGPIRLWSMNGTNLVESIPLNNVQSVGTGWKVVRIGDFNHDDHWDLVLQHTSGAVSIWTMNGTEIVDKIPLQGAQPTGAAWKVVGVGDFNGDGENDLLLQHSNGLLSVWFLNGTEFQSSALLNNGKAVNPVWRVIGIQ